MVIPDLGQFDAVDSFLVVPPPCSPTSQRSLPTAEVVGTRPVGGLGEGGGALMAGFK